MTERYADPADPLNGSKYHTGKPCIERGCTNPAGTAWSAFWCQPCNARRMARIGASPENMADEIGVQVDAISLTDAQRDGLTVKREVSIPGVRGIAAPAAMASAVQPKNDDDALLIDRLFRVTLGGDSLAIDSARMALRQRMNELRTAAGAQPVDAPSTPCERFKVIAELLGHGVAQEHPGGRFIYPEVQRAWEAFSAAYGAKVDAPEPESGAYYDAVSDLIDQHPAGRPMSRTSGAKTCDGAAPREAPRYFCNKCGYRGTVQVGHQRPNGSGECNYVASLALGVDTSRGGEQ